MTKVNNVQMVYMVNILDMSVHVGNVGIGAMMSRVDKVYNLKMVAIEDKVEMQTS